MSEGICEPPTPDPGSSYVTVAGVERKCWALTAALVAGSFFFRSPEITLGAAIGAVLTILNFKWLSAFAGRLIRGPRPSQWRVLLYTMKYVVTGLAIYAAFKYYLANVFAFLAGVSVIFVAICWEGAAHQIRMRGGADHAAEL